VPDAAELAYAEIRRWSPMRLPDVVAYRLVSVADRDTDSMRDWS
jgi:hypothetical protein